MQTAYAKNDENKEKEKKEGGYEHLDVSVSVASRYFASAPLNVHLPKRKLFYSCK